MLLEAAAEQAAKSNSRKDYAFPILEGKLLELDWRPLYSGIARRPFGGRITQRHGHAFSPKPSERNCFRL